MKIDSRQILLQYVLGGALLIQEITSRSSLWLDRVFRERILASPFFSGAAAAGAWVF
jgi:hypothetical protein